MILKEVTPGWWKATAWRFTPGRPVERGVFFGRDRDDVFNRAQQWMKKARRETAARRVSRWAVAAAQ